MPENEKIVTNRTQKRVELFVNAFCPFCSQAKAFLDIKGIRYESNEVVMVMGWKPPLKAFREMKERSGGQTEVPQIFVDGQHYGDEETLLADDETGKLIDIFFHPAIA